jgi:hypothetical protein
MHRLIVGGSRADRLSAAAELETIPPVVHLDASTLPFVSPAWSPPRAAGARTIRIDDIELAFPNHQSSGTRLVLTQSPDRRSRAR